jgi:hypothetical protein
MLSQELPCNVTLPVTRGVPTLKYTLLISSLGAGGSSVIIVSDYRLNERGSISGRGKEFFF